VVVARTAAAVLCKAPGFALAAAAAAAAAPYLAVVRDLDRVAGPERRAAAAGRGEVVQVDRRIPAAAVAADALNSAVDDQPQSRPLGPLADVDRGKGAIRMQRRWRCFREDPRPDLYA